MSYCLNKVTIECTEEESKGIREALTGCDNLFRVLVHFDFNRIIPVPIHLAARELNADGRVVKKDPEANAWRLKHWGAELTGYYPDISYADGILSYEFPTITQPEKVIKRLSALYPTNTIIHYYLENEFLFHGAVRYRGGQVVKTGVLHFRKICAMFGFNNFVDYNYEPDDDEG
ncbi:hypothetical protein BROC_01378 [Candidatus Brocadiaceae bacterium]|nr:hypothetical protein BROC_01378 [Candidatus Brocadiaceae bacterium]